MARMNLFGFARARTLAALAMSSWGAVVHVCHVRHDVRDSGTVL